MATYTQANRPMSVTTPLGKDALLLVGFHGEEAVSRLYHFQLDLLALHATPILFDKIVGQPVGVKLALPGRGTRFFHGIVRRFRQGRRDETFTHFQADVVPQFWLWTRKAQSRIFQHLSIPDILKRVLAGLTVTWEIRGSYHPRDYCVQYRESDFDFANRLMEEEGIYYYFKHAEGGHHLVVTDAPAQHPDVPAPSQVIYDELRGGTRDEARVMAWDKEQEVCPGRYTLWDHTFELPGKNLEARQGVLETVQAGTVTHHLTAGRNEQLELYDYPGGYAQRFDGVTKGGGDQSADLRKIFEDNKRTTKIRMEQETAPAVQVHGESNCGQFLPGHQFTLTRHFDADGPYFLTRVRHQARMTGNFRSGENVQYEYGNDFDGIPVALPYRPPRQTARPTIPGTQTATVVGPNGEEVFVDKYGRIKVQFPWDRQGKNDADSSCWVRVAQVWAGKGWGAFFWPRIGQEVVVAFEEGDPDRPIVVGSVYNAENMPPFALPDEKLVNGVKSCTERGQPHKNFNALIFYDKKGDEHTQIHSEKHQVFTNETSKHHFIGAEHTKIVGGLPLLGSGSGGQDGQDQPGDQPAGSYNLKDRAPPGGFGKDLDLTYGEAFDGMLGLKFESTIGGAIGFTWDPFSTALGEAGKLNTSLLMAPVAGLMTLLGSTEFKFCTDASFLYGPKFDIQRGPAYVWQDDLGQNPGVLMLAELLQVMPLLMVLTYEGLKSKDWSLQERNGWWFGLNAVWTVMAMAVAGFERFNAVADICKKVMDEHQALIQQLTPLIAPTRLLGQQCMKPVLDKIQTTTQGVPKMVVNAADAQKANEAWKGWGFPDVQSANGIFLRQAHDIELIAAWDKPPAGYGICIDAQGGGPDKKDGNLILNGTASVILTSGTSGMSITAKDNLIVLECDESGAIKIRNPALGVEPSVYVSNEKILMSVGPSAVPDACSTISITSDAITLQCGPVAKLQLTKMGIKLMLTDQNTIELKPTSVDVKGLNVNVNGQIQGQFQGGVQTKKTAGAMLQAQGAITMIG